MKAAKAFSRFFSGSRSKKDNDDTSSEKAKRERPASTSKARSSIGSSSSESDVEMVVEIDENERYHSVSKKWSCDHLEADDPKRYVSSAGESDTFPDLPIADGWVYEGSW